MDQFEGKKLLHICEVCGKTELLTPQEAFDAGWDYPPRMGKFGIVSPRTCGSCSMEDTAWAAMVLFKKKPEELKENQVRTILRILCEPDSILPDSTEFVIFTDRKEE